jgi:hypothetical protein
MAFQSLVVQVNQSQHLSTQVFLDNVSYRLDFYVTRVPDLSTGVSANYWYLDLYDSSDNAIVLGIGLVTGIDILFPYRALNVPAGKLFVSPQETAYIDPTENTFINDEALLLYQPAADVLALGVSG